MKVIIAGSRSVTKAQFYLALGRVEFWSWGATEIVHGACPTGADYWAARFASPWDIPTKPFPADWDRYGLAAGPIRNREMAAYGDVLLAIWNGKSRGTKNMIDEARRAGLRVYIYRTDLDTVEVLEASK